MKSRLLIKWCVFLFVAAALCPAAQAQPAVIETIELAMKAGDAGRISGYFGNTVDITINREQSTYSPVQAQMVLRDFFKRNAVRNFDFTHSGTPATSNITFLVGRLTTASGAYRVYMYVKQQPESGSVLREIKIQK